MTEDDSVGQSDDPNNVRLDISDSIHHYYQPAFYYPASWTGLLTITSQIPGAVVTKTFWLHSFIFKHLSKEIK
jgi:hypothetical protein